MRSDDRFVPYTTGNGFCKTFDRDAVQGQAGLPEGYKSLGK